MTLKHGWIPQGDETLMEIRVAPKFAQIKYTTDGSEPLLHGGIYQSPFIVQPMTLISFVGVKDAFHSEIKHIKVPVKPTKFEINKTEPLTWKVRLKRDSTSESYKLAEALKKTGAQVSAVVIDSQAEGWVSLQTSPELTFDANQLEGYMKFIQDQVYGKGTLRLQIDACHFETGQKFLDLIRELKTEYKENEIEQ